MQFSVSVKSVACLLLVAGTHAQKPTTHMATPVEHHGKAPRTAMGSLAPEQIHLALGESPDLMRVQWATFDINCSSSETVVSYGTDKKNLLSTVEGECFHFQPSSSAIAMSLHVATMTGLEASTKYFYQVGGASSHTSKTFNFRTAPDASTLEAHLPQYFLVWGDMGSSLSGPTDSTTIMPYASVEVEAGNVDMILHVGDFGYNMNDQDGAIGSLYMNEIQNMSAYTPYMVDPGNHEVSYNFAYYTEFFRNMPANPEHPTVTTDNGVAPNNWYFSFNMGLVHFVTLSSEIYYDYPDMAADQWEWLKADLEAANKNRTEAPWIIVNAHRPLYCSCDDDCDESASTMRVGILQSDGTRLWGLDQVFYDYGVDLFLAGHEHNYERTYDVAPMENSDSPWKSGYTTQSTTNPPATTHIVTGDAGNDENHETFTRRQPSRTAFRTDAYGYSRMTIHNESHMFWQQVECDSSRDPVVEATVIDEFWLIMENHGSFNGSFTA